jgi:hypothetical protein
MEFLFILGCHRSGTTVLQQALNRHSAIAIPPETKYFSSFLGHSHRCQIRRLARINEDLQINLAPPSRSICDKHDARQFFAHMDRAYTETIKKKSAVYFGEKTPTHSGYVPQIRKIFPEAKLLWIYRDGRDVALSLRKVPWMDRSLAVNFLIWVFYCAKQQRLAADKIWDIHFIKYEDLVAQPVTELSNVTNFLGLPFEPAMALGHGNREGVLDWELPWKAKAIEPISAKHVGLWQKELSRDEVAFLEWLGGRALRTLGYPLTIAEQSSFHCFKWPKLALEAARFIYHVPLDEMANQFLGRAICFD